MAGGMRKMAVYLGLVEDDQYEDDLSFSNNRSSDNYSNDDADYRSRGGPSSSRGYSDRTSDTVRVSDTDDDEATRRRGTTSRPTRDWRTDTAATDQVGSHPAGSRAKAPARPGAADGYKITTLHPRSYNDARRIGEEFRSGTPVIMNLTELDDTDAKRIVDFAAGLVFGLRGSIERVTNKVFMLSPANVQVGADVARAQLAQEGLANQH